MTSEQIQTREFLKGQGYLFLTWIPGREWCGIDPNFIFYRALVYGMDRCGRKGHYGYLWLGDLLQDLAQWDGAGDPPGMWIVHKGSNGKFKNPRLGDADISGFVEEI